MTPQSAGKFFAAMDSRMLSSAQPVMTDVIDGIRLRNVFSKKRERALSLDAFADPDAFASVPANQFDDTEWQLQQAAARYRLDRAEVAYLRARIVEGYTLHELPAVLHCSAREVERLRKSVNRKLFPRSRKSKSKI